MHVIDLEGNEYALQSTSTNDNETNGNQSLSATIPPTRANKLFIDDITEMWRVFDHDDVEHVIIYCKRKGEGERLRVEIKAIPLFFDTLDNDRIYERHDEHMTANSAFTKIFDGTGFGFILSDSFNAVQWEGFGDGETKLETFKRALERYKAEFRIVGNTVYLESQIGRDTSIMYRHRLNASNIVQEVDAKEMWTYAKGYGDYDSGDDGGWENAGLEREYTSPLADILGIRHAPPIKNGNITDKSTMDSQLKTLVDESLKISVSADIHDLRNQGYPIAQSEVGDRVFLIDERIGLNDEVRVISQSITRNWRGDVIDLNITFGSEGIAKRHQSNISNAVKDIKDLLDGKKVLPYSVLDEAVKNATKALRDAQTELAFSDNGILAVDKNDPNLVTLFNSAGLGVSNDGGNTFENAITGEGINASTIYTGTMLADRIAGGVLSSLNGNTDFSLNTGQLTMANTEFTLGGGADIHFSDVGNRLYYNRNQWASGVGFGRSLNDTYPYVFLGTSEGTKPRPSDNVDFSGFIANTNAREKVDNIGNSVVGNRFHVRDKPVSFDRGFLFKTDTDAYFSPMNTGSHDYDLGRPNNRFNNAYLKSNPDVSSDRRIKKDISDISLNFAKKFLEVNSKRYRKKLTNANMNTKVRGINPFEFGFIAQDVESLFDETKFESLVSTDKDGNKSMQYGQVSAIHHVLLQDIYKRLDVIESE